MCNFSLLLDEGELDKHLFLTFLFYHIHLLLLCYLISSPILYNLDEDFFPIKVLILDVIIRPSFLELTLPHCECLFFRKLFIITSNPCT